MNSPASLEHVSDSVPPVTVDVWFIRSGAPSAAELRGDYEALLSEDERRRHRRFATPEKRHEYLMARGLVRTMLSRYWNVGPRAWSFGVGRFGKPRVIEPVLQPDLCFSISHSSGVVACAVARDCEIGLDIESLRRPIEYRSVARTVFAPAELQELERLPEPAARHRFFRLWTLKEAYAKARGTGFALPFDQFWFSLDATPPIAVQSEQKQPEDESDWTFRLLDLAPEHLLAVAVHGHRGRAVQVALRDATLADCDLPAGAN